jgi:hypothetical protein
VLLSPHWLATLSLGFVGEPMGTKSWGSSVQGPVWETCVCLTTCSRWFLARLIFDPEDGGDTFLRNVGSYTDYTALCPRRWQISLLCMLQSPYPKLLPLSLPEVLPSLKYTTTRRASCYRLGTLKAGKSFCPSPLNVVSLSAPPPHFLFSLSRQKSLSPGSLVIQSLHL